jgi:hypothetical protein
METKKVTYEALEGCNIGSVQIENGRLIVVYECATPEAPKFKTGDFVVIEETDRRYYSIGIFGGENVNWLWIYNINANKASGFVAEDPDRLATPEEKQLLIDKMREQGKDWNGEQVVDWVWRPKIGEPYWCIVFNPLRAEIVEWCNDSVDNERLKDNRVFATEALAKAAFIDLQTVLKNAKKY